MQYVVRNRARLLYTVPIVGLLIFAALAPLFAAPEIDVLCISRTPRYEKYLTDDQEVSPQVHLVLAKDGTFGTEYTKKVVPAGGDTVTFTATVTNMGTTDVASCHYTWYLDGSPVQSGTITGLNHNPTPTNPQTIIKKTVSYSKIWDTDEQTNPHVIMFVADPGHLITGDNTANNTRQVYSNALSFRMFFSDAFSNYMINQTDDTNLKSPEDWAWKQLNYVNGLFANAIWPATPTGLAEHVFLDDAVRVLNTFPPLGDPSETDWDCRWYFTDDLSWLPQGPWITGPSIWTIHEWGHQLGLPDMYQLNVPAGAVTNPVYPALGHLEFYCNDLMKGNDQVLSAFTAYGLKANLNKRRCEYGEHYYDLPTTCKVKVVDAYYRPITSATVTAYQKGIDGKIKTTAAFSSLTTDASGVITLPNLSALIPVDYREPDGTYVSPTGHTLHTNPWGPLDCVGCNELFLLKIQKSGTTDYQWVESLQFTVALAEGSVNPVVVQSNICNTTKPCSNDLYGIKMLSATDGHAVGASGRLVYYNGTIWSNKTSPTTNAIRAIDAKNIGGTRYVWAVGDAGTIVKYSYSTNSWTRLTTPPAGTPYLRAVAILNATTLIVGGTNGTVYKSTNSGASWTAVFDTISNIGINSIRFYDASRGVMACNSGVTYYTTNGGANWTMSTYDHDPSGTMLDCCMTSTSNAWVMDETGLAYKSTNGGASFTQLWGGGGSDPWCGIDTVDTGYGWAVGGLNSDKGFCNCRRLDGVRYCSESGVVHTTCTTLYDISCVSATEAWACGKAGTLMHFKK